MFKRIVIIIIVAIATSLAGFVVSANSATDSDQINVNYTVGPTGPVCGSNGCEAGEDCNNCPGDCGGPCIVTCTDAGAPIMSVPDVEAGSTRATTTWSLTDNCGFNFPRYEYGLSTAYGSNGVAEYVSGDNKDGVYRKVLAGLTPNTTYYFRAYTTDVVNNPVERTGQFTTVDGGCTGDCEAPQIGAIASSTTSNSAIVTWTATDNVAVQGCSLSYGVGFTVVIPVRNGNNFTASVSGLSSQTVYNFTIDCSDTNNNPDSATGKFTTTGTPPNSPPSILNVNLITASSSATITWDVSNTEGAGDISGVLLDYGANVSYALSGTVIGDYPHYSSTLSNLSPSTTYNYRISVADYGGNATDHTGAFTIPGGVDNPPQIKNVLASAGNTVATITFLVSDDQGFSSDPIFEYGISLSYDGTAIPEQVGGAIGIIDRSYTVNLNGLTNEIPYYFRISITDTGQHTTSTTGEFTPSRNALRIVSPVVSAGANNLLASWLTNLAANGQIDFGTSTLYGRDALVSPYTLSHNLEATGLISCTDYFYRLISSNGDETAQVSGGPITTAGESTPPATPDLNLSTTTRSILLNWDNSADIDFDRVQITRGVDGMDPFTLIYSGAGNTITQTTSTPPALEINTNYCYRISAVDKCGNPSGENQQCGLITGEIPPNCNNGVINFGENCDGDNLNGATCTSVDPQFTRGILACNENCTFNTSNCVGPDPTCADRCGESSCRCSTECVLSAEVCGNGIDDDCNGKADCADQACIDAGNCNVVESRNLELSFLAGSRNITLENLNQTVTGLTGAHLSVGVSRASMYADPLTANLILNNSNYSFLPPTFDGLNYFSDISFPAPGTHQASVDIDYGNNHRDIAMFSIVSLPMGTVRLDKGVSTSSATIILYNEDGTQFNAAAYGQENPQVIPIGGLYGWMVPNGNYYLSISDDVEYYGHDTQLFAINNNVVNNSVTLIAKPKPLDEIIDPDADITENILNVAESLADQTRAITARGVEFFKETVDNPNVESAAPTIAGTIAGAAVAGLILAVPWLNLWALLQFLFLEPLLILGRKKREQWGLVYNSLTKLPLDLAIVRLVDAKTNMVVQSKVTGRDGRYMLVARPGQYRISVVKSNAVFPSVFLKDLESDGRRTDLYHGEIINVEINNTMVTANIPLDPVGVDKTPLRLRWERWLTLFQKYISGLGIAGTLLALYITPKWYVWVILAAHIALYMAFKRLSVSAKPKGWGIVYEAKTKHPIGSVIARLFDAQFNKLVATEITDRLGRYSFLAGDSKYYVAYDRKGYDPKRTEVIDLTNKESKVIAQDVVLTKAGSEPKIDVLPPVQTTPTNSIPPSAPAAALSAPVNSDESAGDSAVINKNNDNPAVVIKPDEGEKKSIVG